MSLNFESMDLKTKKSETPLMQQYAAIKGQYPDALLLFRVGDFYETFGEDAIKTARILGIVLTKRANGSASSVELAGFPHHALETYLPKLVQAGNRVAICDQLEDPKFAKSIVKRGVTELVSPGIVFNDRVLDQNKNNFLAAVYFDSGKASAAFLDASTGEFRVAEGNEEFVEKLIHNLQPSELLYSKPQKANIVRLFGSRFYEFPLDEWVFTGSYGEDKLMAQFGTRSLKGFGIDSRPLSIAAAGAALHYVLQTRSEPMQHIRGLQRIEPDGSVWMDRFTIRNLELFASPADGGRSLFEVINQTISPGGSRLLRQWLGFPLSSLPAILERQSICTWFHDHDAARKQMRELLRSCGDPERLSARIAVAKAGPRELLALRRSIKVVEETVQQFGKDTQPELELLCSRFHACSALAAKLDTWLNPDAPALLNKGNVIASGVNQKLDDLRDLLHNGKEYLRKMEERERENTGIGSLKIGYNNVFGYYFEVTHTHTSKVPENWTRRQTLTNAERYITPELKQYEEKILGAEDQILQLENALFTELIEVCQRFIPQVQENAALLARLDVLQGFAELAVLRNYCKPELHEGWDIDIRDGRHPVLEQLLPPDQPYISNDFCMSQTACSMMMITGPNMAGKSAYLRQNALIVILAQMGAYVPARQARIGLVDKVFTRVGASDNLAAGESTFMVEMNETASILNNLSAASLILMDEIGRGTSTYDGVSIAWAIAEYLHQHPHRPKTLFATHYHELNEMADRFAGIKNYTVAVKESGKQIIFLRKVKAGGSEHSFGIHVAKMAGMPPAVIQRAEEVLIHLEGLRHSKEGAPKSMSKSNDSNMQLSIFQLDDPLADELKGMLRNLDLNTITPVEALLKLQEIKQRLKLNS